MAIRRQFEKSFSSAGPNAPGQWNEVMGDQYENERIAVRSRQHVCVIRCTFTAPGPHRRHRKIGCTPYSPNDSAHHRRRSPTPTDAPNCHSVRGMRLLGGNPVAVAPQCDSGWSETILAQAVSVQASSMLPWGPSQWPILATFPCGCRARRRSWQTRLPPDL